MMSWQKEWNARQEGVRATEGLVEIVRVIQKGRKRTMTGSISQNIT